MADDPDPPRPRHSPRRCSRARSSAAISLASVLKYTGCASGRSCRGQSAGLRTGFDSAVALSRPASACAGARRSARRTAGCWCPGALRGRSARGGRIGRWRRRRRWFRRGGRSRRRRQTIGRRGSLGDELADARAAPAGGRSDGELAVDPIARRQLRLDHRLGFGLSGRIRELDPGAAPDRLRPAGSRAGARASPPPGRSGGWPSRPWWAQPALSAVGPSPAGPARRS